MEDYRVQLDFYDGPMDLLLYLVRRNEVDIHDIPIARITDQYCRWVEMMRAIDINLAGEFLVMAAWLIEIKTRLLLPTLPPAGEGAEGETSAAAELADPRAELVRQLLAYKQFKDLAEELGDVHAEHSLRHPRAGIDWKQIAGDEDEQALDIADVQIWDLFEAFGRLMEQTGRFRDHQVTYDDTPISEHQEALVLHLKTHGPTRFEHLFEGRTHGQVLGLFLAMLELIRQKRLRIEQERAFGSIFIMLAEQVTDVRADEAAAETPPAGPDAGGAPAAGDAATADAAKSDEAGHAGGKPWEKKADDKPADGSGVTWIDPAEMEEMLDDDLREIDRALRGIKVPPDPDTLMQPPRPDPGAPESGAEESTSVPDAAPQPPAASDEAPVDDGQAAAGDVDEGQAEPTDESKQDG